MTGLGVSGRVARFFLSSQLTPLIAIVLVIAGVFAVIVTPREFFHGGELLLLKQQVHQQRLTGCGWTRHRD